MDWITKQRWCPLRDQCWLLMSPPQQLNKQQWWSNIWGSPAGCIPKREHQWSNQTTEQPHPFLQASVLSEDPCRPSLPRKTRATLHSMICGQAQLRLSLNPQNGHSLLLITTATVILCTLLPLRLASNIGRWSQTFFCMPCIDTLFEGKKKQIKCTVCESIWALLCKEHTN